MPTPPTQRARLPELDAMHRIERLFAGLDPAARERTLVWLCARYGLAMEPERPAPDLRSREGLT